MHPTPRLLCSALAALLGLFLQAGETSPGGGAVNGRLQTERHFYLLQADVLVRRMKGGAEARRAAAIGMIAAVNADTYVLDAYYADSPSAAGLYTADELQRIRAAQPALSHPRTLLAYLSIGEAENYRSYWNPAWDADNDGKVDPGAPVWLLNQDPHWKGNYPVKYWNPDWQALIFGVPNAALDRILAQGFDGVYLDIVDGFETFENGTDNRINPETGQSYRRDMIDFVLKLAHYARQRRPGFFVVPQNGTQLLDADDFLAAISGQGQEDLYYLTDKPQPPNETAETVKHLKTVTAQGKAVLITDYSKTPKHQADDIARGHADGFSIFIAPRELNGMGRSP